MGRTDGERVRLKWYSMSIRISPLLGMLPSARSPVYCKECLWLIHIGNGQRFSPGVNNEINGRIKQFLK